MKFNTHRWLMISLINLLIVSLLGSLMRYKIGYSFPHFNQKSILHAHSHFAFLGWITQSLYILIIHFLHEKSEKIDIAKYNRFLRLNLFCAYMILITFFTKGYSPASIGFLCFNIVLACIFTYNFIRDFKTINSTDISLPWFKAALCFNIFSSLGTFYLGYMMGSHHFNERWYLAAVYFYLHFQYNGFFFFTIMGLTLFKIHHLLPSYVYSKKIYYLFVASVVPAYFLSTLWADLPVWLYIIVVLAAFGQAFGWVVFVRSVRQHLHSLIPTKAFVKYLVIFVFVACSVKLALQLGSTIPQLSQMAFGFRPIVIAYLHLVLLGVVTFFILSYMYINHLIYINKGTKTALATFSAGVLLNETLLGAQGVFSFSYTAVPHVNDYLFIVSLFLLFGAVLLVSSQISKKQDTDSV